MDTGLRSSTRNPSLDTAGVQLTVDILEAPMEDILETPITDIPETLTVDIPKAPKPMEDTK